MDWVKQFQLFLFDFDGLLVNTENLHFQAYQTMCQKHGCHLNWDFSTYCSYAHIDSKCLQQALFKEFPSLKEMAWDVLYQEKQQAYCSHLESECNLLMPGVDALLKRLEKEQISRCVVTHSVKEHVDLIREKYPILNTIPHWITRFDYKEPKPHPECYLTAIAKYAQPGQKIIGFEDSLRGFRALQETCAVPVLISHIGKDEVMKFCRKNFYVFSSFDDVHFSKEVL